MSYTRTTKDAQQLMRQAYERTDKIPRIIYTDKLAAYLDGIELTFGADTEHRRGSPFDVGSNNNYMERFHSTLKSRTKVMRGLHTVESARKYLDGWLVHYNFFRPHMSLKDRTPASVAGIRFPFHNWKDITEQPYEKTARILVKAYTPVPKGAIIPRTACKVIKCKKTVKREIHTREKPITSLSQVRFK